MLRVISNIVHAEPFGSLADVDPAQRRLLEELELVNKAHGNALPVDDREAAVRIARLRRKVRAFEWRLAATGSRLPEGDPRKFAQSILEFWSLQQADLRALTGRFRPDRQSSRARSGAVSARALLPYDETSAAAVAQEAERLFEALPGDDERRVVERAFIDIVRRRALPEAVPRLGPFLAAGVVIGPRAGRDFYDLGHEQLPQAWPRLGAWLAAAEAVDADRERMRGGAEAWARTGSSAELPRGDVLERAVKYSRVDDDLEAYVKAAKEKRRRERLTIGVTALGLVVSVGAFLYELYSVPETLREAKVTRQTADAQQLDDVPGTGVFAASDTVAGVEGWIWIGSSDVAQIALDKGKDEFKLAEIAAGTKVRLRANLKLREQPPADDGKNRAGERQAGVSAGTLAVALEPSRAVMVDGVPQYWLKIRSIPMVYIQLDQAAALDLDGISAELEGAGLLVPAAQRLPGMAREGQSFDVRYYYEQDAPAARRVRAIVAGHLTSPEPAGTLTGLVGSPLAERVKTGTIEVWIYRR